MSEEEISQEKEKALKTVARTGSFLFVGIMISRFFGYLTRVALARYLDPSAMGLIYLANSVCGVLFTISIFGLPKAVQRYVSYYKEEEKLGKVKGVITNSLKISFPVSIVVSFILFIFSDYIAAAIFHKPILSIALKTLAFSIPFRVILTISDTSMKGFKIARYHIYVRKILEPISKFFIAIVLIFIGFKVAAGAGGYSLGFIVSAVISFYFLETKVFSILKTKVKSVSLKKKLIKFSWPLMLAGILWTITGHIDNLMIGSLIKESEPLGIYTAAFPTTKFLRIIPMALMTLFLPIISGLLSKGKEEEINDIYKTVSKWIFYVNFPIFLLLLIFPHAILGVLFGNEFMKGGLVLSVLSVGFFIGAFGSLAGRMIDLLERTKFHLLNSVTVIIIDVVLNYFLIPIYGILGAGIATSTTFLVYALMQMLEAYYFTGTHPLTKNFLKSFISAVLAGGLLYWVTNIWLEELDIFVIVISILCFFLIYSILLLLMRGLDREDIMILKALERKTGIKIKWLREIIKKFS